MQDRRSISSYNQNRRGFKYQSGDYGHHEMSTHADPEDLESKEACYIIGIKREDLIKKYEEECKVSIRNVRRDFNDQIRKLEKESIPKDDCHKGQEKLQKITDEKINIVHEIAKAKEKNILETWYKFLGAA